MSCNALLDIRLQICHLTCSCKHRYLRQIIIFHQQIRDALFHCNAVLVSVNLCKKTKSANKVQY